MHTPLPHQSALLRSPDPLVSYQAASLLLQAARCPWDWPLPGDDWLAALLAVVNGPDDAAAFPSSITPRGLTNFVEGCRRLAAGMGHDGDDGDGAQDGAGVRGVRHRADILATLASALPGMQR